MGSGDGVEAADFDFRHPPPYHHRSSIVPAWAPIHAPCHISMSASGHATPSPQAFDARQFRDTLAQFATGVTIICARAADGRLVGFTANSFNSVSLDPPLILWSLERRSASLATFEACERYTVNVLSAAQAELARRFSRPHADRFSGVPYRMGWADAPLIAGCIAWFECHHHSRHQAGDHVVFIGEVATCERAPGRGLVFQHGRFGATVALPGH